MVEERLSLLLWGTRPARLAFSISGTGGSGKPSVTATLLVSGLEV